MNRMASLFFTAILVSQPVIGAETLTEAITNGTPSGDIRIRYENVDNDITDSDGMTIRTRLGYMTDAYANFSAFIEFEDVRDMFGIDDDEDLIPDRRTRRLAPGSPDFRCGAGPVHADRRVIG